jgi:hypothetical protein
MSWRHDFVSALLHPWRRASRCMHSWQMLSWSLQVLELSGRPKLNLYISYVQYLSHTNKHPSLVFMYWVEVGVVSRCHTVWHFISTFVPVTLLSHWQCMPHYIPDHLCKCQTYGPELHKCVIWQHFSLKQEIGQISTDLQISGHVIERILKLWCETRPVMPQGPRKHAPRKKLMLPEEIDVSGVLDYIYMLHSWFASCSWLGLWSTTPTCIWMKFKNKCYWGMASLSVYWQFGILWPTWVCHTKRWTLVLTPTIPTDQVHRQLSKAAAECNTATQIHPIWDHRRIPQMSGFHWQVADQLSHVI